MMKIRKQLLLHSAIISVALIFWAGGAIAKKPDWAGGGTARETKELRSDIGPSGQTSHGDRLNVPLSVGSSIEVRSNSPYDGKKKYKGTCPPGLEKKNNSCLPPGQEKKQGW